VLFFVLSGALLTTILDETRSTESRYRNFLTRRALRIFPLYFGYLVAAAIATLVVTGSAPRHFWVYCLFVQNIFVHTAEQTGSIFHTYHLWTISVQDQFYVIWPLLLWRAKTLRQMRVLCISGIACSVVVRLLILGSWRPMEPLLRSLPAVAGCMCLGGLIALERRERTWLTPLLLRSLVPLSIVCALWMWHGLDFSSPLGSLAGYPLAAVACAALISTAMQPGSLAARILATRPIALAGRKLAYGLYMLHPLVLDLCVRHMGSQSKAVRLSAFLLGTVALSWLSYRFLESPFLRLRLGRPAPAQQRDHSPARRPHLVPPKTLGTTSAARRQSTG
jgi:peptidoglycan/LPS O-acetylase OafA/YrhL